MNNNNFEYFSTMHVLIPPAPFSCKQKKGVRRFLAPLCEAERGWGEYMRTDD